jgi:hypothetical protein
MQQIPQWLEKLGLGQYAQRFAEHDIDVSVLPYDSARLVTSGKSFSSRPAIRYGSSTKSPRARSTSLVSYAALIQIVGLFRCGRFRQLLLSAIV